MVHFILVHGIGHGGWCWDRLAALLTAAGHIVTAPDLSASGFNSKLLDQVHSASDYFQPLMDVMESLPADAKVILVGHSFGGLGISFAVERFPEKVSVAVFVTAVMPSPAVPASTIVQEVFSGLDSTMDCTFLFDRGSEKFPSTVIFGPQFLSSKLYQHSPPEALKLATTLVRPASMFIEDISDQSLLSEKKYGSSNRVYIVSKKDELMKEEVQRWIISKSSAKEVKEIHGSDHMVMFSKPQELCNSLLQIAQKYS
ncbi:methyl jasmonate esterase 1-like [Aristolochia californica]|uniref:methyl jasmonate esterase 1-like n=1 Tax=Aristolochia californica TaxID=171875 RepID=UPI0035D8F82C